MGSFYRYYLQAIIYQIKQEKNTYGFTLLELLVALGMFSILVGITTINLINSKEKATTSTSVTSILADINQQQTKAMSGDTEGGGSIENKGVYFEPTRYTLFRGNQYNPTNPTNFVVALDANLQFTNITFPSSTLLFASGSGEFIGYLATRSAVSLTNTVNNSTRTIRFNRYGVLTQIN